MDAFPPGFASYRKAFPELVIPTDPGDSDTTAEASAGSTDVGKKNLPHNISPALSENSTPSHCNCKKSKCLKL